jgi:hypothetical protein
VVSSESPNEWLVSFVNGQTKVMKCIQLFLHRGGKGPPPPKESKDEEPFISSPPSFAFHSPMPRDKMLHDPDNDKHVSTINLPTKKAKKQTKPICGSATADNNDDDDDNQDWLVQRCDSSDDDESYIDDENDDNSSDDSGDDNNNDDDDDDNNDNNNDDDVDEFKLKLYSFNAKIKSLYGKTIKLVVGNAKKNKEKIVWEVINDHCPTEALDEWSKTYLGTQSQAVLDSLEDSSVPLADLFLYLLFKDGQWRRWLRIMNDKVETKNNNRTAGERSTPKFTKEEFITGHALLIGAADCADRGQTLWEQAEDDNEAWHSIAAHTNFSPYMKLY